ncbi:bucentaur or craniofacial development-domain-containing protein [Panaeolus papilionaceus]|nr:bucentaur or craniofacial development-domain-containing protein [Panaeolus papilionaceus]
MPMGSGHNPHDSDSDDDDYIPNDDADSSGYESSDTEADKLAARSTDEAAKNPVESRRHREALWADFQQSLANENKRQRSRSRPRMIKIIRRYRFAGENTEEVVEVPEDSEDAQRWPHWIDNTAIPEASTKESSSQSPSIDTSTQPEGDASQSPVEELWASSSTLVSTPAPSQLQPKGRPGPRKPKTTLADIPGSTKPKKLTTLDKSALDWQAHVQDQARSGSSLQDELEANRRGGGYLEKVEFLRRVEDRKEETIESLKSNKRRKL